MMTSKIHMLLQSLLVLTLSASVYSAEDCNRQCLINLAEDYLAALVAHDPARVNLSRELITVENLQRIELNEGLWETASVLPDNFKLFIPDVEAQQIGLMVVMQEARQGSSELIQVAIRLQLSGNEIVEAEHLINREIDELSLQHLQHPRKPLLSAVPSLYKDSRDRLLGIASSYYEALVKSNGALAPFGDDCVRHENGHQTSRNPIPADPLNDFAIFGSLGCAAQLNTQIYAYIDSIDQRRVEIADIETGMVFGLSHFRQKMGDSPYQTIGVPGHTEFVDERDSYDLSAVHIFKIWAGQIHEVEAVGIFTDYMTTTGWE